MKKIAIFFPGIGYHCDKPLLYYSRKIVVENGYTECMNLDYKYDGKGIRGDEHKMQEAFESLYAQAEKMLVKVKLDEYDDVLFVSKSVGTIISSAYAEKHNIKCRQILYTPLKQTYQFKHEDAIAFIGTSDPWSNTEEVVRLSREQNVTIHVYNEANHSLETSDILESIKILENVMKKTKEYI
ncbi:alpha/beta family hydrolase [Lachnospiraceae bacterium HCP1S3_C3]